MGYFLTFLGGLFVGFFLMAFIAGASRGNGE